MRSSIQAGVPKPERNNRRPPCDLFCASMWLVLLLTRPQTCTDTHRYISVYVLFAPKNQAFHMWQRVQCPAEVV